MYGKSQLLYCLDRQKYKLYQADILKMHIVKSAIQMNLSSQKNYEIIGILYKYSIQYSVNISVF